MKLVGFIFLATSGPSQRVGGKERILNPGSFTLKVHLEQGEVDDQRSTSPVNKFIQNPFHCYLVLILRAAIKREKYH